MATFKILSTLSFILHINNILTESLPTINDLRSNPVGVLSSSDMVKVNLGISEDYPNSRVAYYIDVNNDK